ncbi:MAG TPA: GNAT family N-acetyltransferase [Burkholderiales bacterium]|nr:GNAT family N-acetyltransferase [Burkholderiales bacterium]
MAQVRLSYIGQLTQLRNSKAVQIRPVAPRDAEAVQAFVRGLSISSRYFRFMMGISQLSDDMLARFTNPRAGREGVLVAWAAEPSIDSTLIGMAQYVADETGGSCDFAVVVSDPWQRQGLGRRLVSDLIRIAAQDRITCMHADVLADNYAMRGLAEKLGCELHVNPQLPFLLRLSRPLVAPAPEYFDALGSGVVAERQPLSPHEFHRA